ncbi:MAG: hypothetical protein CL912_33560 [Deltaproteobacteria bacterium]|nr:hypothetical protein [Deltaproteobacteria bacterium]
MTRKYCWYEIKPQASQLTLEVLKETYLLGSDAKDILEELWDREIVAWETSIAGKIALDLEKKETKYEHLLISNIENRSILDEAEPGPIKNFPPPRYEDYLTQTCDREGLATPEPGVPQSSQRDRRSHRSRISKKEKKDLAGCVLPQAKDSFAS